MPNKIFANNPFEGIAQDPNGMEGIANILSDIGVGENVTGQISPILGAASVGFNLVTPLTERIRFARESSPTIDSENPTFDSSAFRRNIATVNANKGDTSAARSALKGGAQGAAAGAQFGLIGAGVGALAGGLLGGLGGRKRRMKARRAKKLAERQFESYADRFNQANQSSQMTRDAQDRYNKLVSGSLF